MMPILVVTSDVPFGELIRQNLEETGRFSVRVTEEKGTAVAFVRAVNCSLAFMDTSWGEKDVLETGRLLRKANPKIKFVVVSEVGGASVMEELSPQDYLSKPFYLPDLLEMMDKLLPTPDTLPVSKNVNLSNDLPWLSDVTRAAQHLTRLTLESSAQAALITRSDQLWAYAGQLPQSATKELANTVSRYWDRQEENDLVRFVRLASTDAEHMLYATRLADDMVLALIFDAETPFSTIRTQATQLVHSLSTTPAEEVSSEEQSNDEPPLSSFKDILSDIPSPNPTEREKSISSEPFRESSPAIPLFSLNLPRFSHESSPPVLDKPRIETEQVNASAIANMEETIRSSVITRKTKIKKSELVVEELGETRPSSITEVARQIILEPTSPAVYNLDYACLLVPRFAHHHLTGDLLDQLGKWIPEICIAFGWRLEHISVRPEHLQWIVNVPPATSPGYLMRILRQHTSDKIFNDFPHFKKENPSGDFWAPGYLIMGGSQPPPAQLIKEFVAQTRQRQGISQQFKR
jgi:REP element-mobilizing transposase RayT/CheY-like chemotaxis protein